MNTYEKVKLFADKNQISITDLETKCNLGNGTIGKWKTVEPNLFNLRKVAKIFSVDVKELIGDVSVKEV